MRRRAPQTQVFFLNLVDFVAKLDDVFDEHLKNATVFKGTSKMVQNELLECMLAVARERIVEEVKSACYLAIQADETMDVSTQKQLVLVLRYIDDNHAVQACFLFVYSHLGINISFNCQCAFGETEPAFGRRQRKNETRCTSLRWCECDEGREGWCAAKGA